MNAQPTPDHPVSAADALRSDFANLIDGELVAGKDWFDVLNPATGKPLPGRRRWTHLSWIVRWPAPGVPSAAGAQPPWLTAGRPSSAWPRYPPTSAASLAELLTLEQGKPVGQSRDEISRAASQCVGMAQITIADELLEESAQRHIELKYFPLGVVGIITPWNAPINLAAGPLVAALYTGNTVILKPSPYTPLCTLKIAALLRDVFPAGVLNVVAGGDELGEWMTAHSGIDKISFTGSVETGKKVMASCAGTLKRLTLELGGNDAAIVLTMWIREPSHRSCSSPPSSTAARCAWRSSASARTRASTRSCAWRWRRKPPRRGSAAASSPTCNWGRSRISSSIRKWSAFSTTPPHGRPHPGRGPGPRRRRIFLSAHGRHRYRRPQPAGAGGTVRTNSPGAEIRRRGRRSAACQ